MRQILCPVVVGRHEELDLLQAALDEARQGRGRLVLIRAQVEMTSSGDIADLVRAEALAEREGAVSALALTLQNQCWPHLLTRRWDDLAAANQRCVELCRRFGLGLLPHALIVTGLIQRPTAALLTAQTSTRRPLVTE